MNTSIPNPSHIHLIGIGGIGMSALARILLKRGFSISGSDNNVSPQTIALSNEGVTIFTKQSSENIISICQKYAKQPLIIKSSAIGQNNLELLEAKRADLLIWHRSDLLAFLIEQQPSIVIAGSHGKTSTSSFIATLLTEIGEDPTAIIGGIVPCFKSNAHAGKGKFLIAEADESDGTLIKFKPEIGVITNIELDHTSHYSSILEIIKSLQKYGSQCKNLLANYDCPTAKEHIQADFWWSIKHIKDVHYAGIPLELKADSSIFSYYEKETHICDIKIPLTGMHNLSNIVGAIASCRIAGFELKKITNHLPAITHPLRRFEFKGIWKKRVIIDDYAHHPTEIKATISMARIVMNGEHIFEHKTKRLVAIFQPHRFSRTKSFLDDFAEVLSRADLVIIPPIYGAGEAPIQDINSENIGKKINQIKENLPVYTPKNFNELIHNLEDITQQNDLILCMGAGNINSLWGQLTNQTIHATY